MNKKWLPILIVIALAGILFAVRQCGSMNQSPPANEKDPSGQVNRDRGFDRRTSFLEYTEHAKCRMSCRQVSKSEVEEIMKDGKINYNKSYVNAKPCPTYALEGISRDDQRLRIVFGQCDAKTKVITVIDLNTDWECACPGDDDKYKNKR